MFTLTTPEEEFVNNKLIIEKDKIYYIDPNGNEQQVMMRWEESLMQHHVDVLPVEGGDILEIGFGMGISADMIMKRNPASYTVVEIHPQIIEIAKEWAKGKPNVTIIEGNWLDVLGEIGKKRYDGILFDTYGDRYVPLFVGVLVHRFIKPNGVFTYWKPDNKDTFRIGAAFINPNIQEISAHIPEGCSYMEILPKENEKREIKYCAVPFVQYKDGYPIPVQIPENEIQTNEGN
jgi:SAM-dependent methyltransferase